MLKNNIYNMDKEFDYPTIKGIVLKSIEKIVKEEALKNTANLPHDAIFEDNDYPNNVKPPAPPTSLLHLKHLNHHRTILIQSYYLQ